MNIKNTDDLKSISQQIRESMIFHQPFICLSGLLDSRENSELFLRELKKWGQRTYDILPEEDAQTYIKDILGIIPELKFTQRLNSLTVMANAEMLTKSQKQETALDVIKEVGPGHKLTPEILQNKRNRIIQSSFITGVVAEAFITGEFDFLEDVMSKLHCDLNDFRHSRYLILQEYTFVGDGGVAYSKTAVLSFPGHYPTPTSRLLILNYHEDAVKFLDKHRIPMPEEKYIGQILRDAKASGFLLPVELDNKAVTYRSLLTKRKIVQETVAAVGDRALTDNMSLKNKM